MNVRLFFRQLLGGEIQSERRSQDTAAKFHKVAIAAGIVFNLDKLQHVGALLQISAAEPARRSLWPEHRSVRNGARSSCASPSPSDGHAARDMFGVGWRNRKGTRG